MQKEVKPEDSASRKTTGVRDPVRIRGRRPSWNRRLPFASRISSQIARRAAEVAVECDDPFHSPEPHAAKRDKLSISSSSESSSSADSPPTTPSRAKLVETGEPEAQSESVGPTELPTEPDDIQLPPMRRSSLSALEDKARSIMERELMFEKLLSHSKSHLAEIEEQMSELGNRYMAVRRSTGTVAPSRRKVEMPDLPPSPILENRVVQVKENVNERSLDEIDENFKSVLKFTPPSASGKPPRPPLAPVPFNNRRSAGVPSSLAASKPLLTSRSMPMN